MFVLLKIDDSPNVTQAASQKLNSFLTKIEEIWIAEY